MRNAKTDASDALDRISIRVMPAPGSISGVEDIVDYYDKDRLRTD
ncbi:MAG: hypothetical protein JWQ23_3253 [Herminiimonas sp.]|nr:hypothetical protein [Herminiimonas sp.]